MKATSWLAGLLVSLALLSVLPLARLLSLLLLASPFSSSAGEEDLVVGVVPDNTIIAAVRRQQTNSTASNNNSYNMTGNMTFAQRHSQELPFTTTTLQELVVLQSMNNTTTTTTTTTSSCPPRLEFLHIPKSGGTTIERSATEQANIAWGACHFHLRRPRRKRPFHNQAQPSQQAQSEQRWDLCPLQMTSPVVPLPQWPRDETMSDLWHYPLHWLFLLLEANTNHNHNHTTTTATTTTTPRRRKQRVRLPANPYHNVATTATAAATGTTTTTTTTTCRPQDQELHFFAVIRNPYSRALSEYYYQAGMALQKHPKRLQNAKFMNQWLASKLREYYKHIMMDNNNNNSSNRASWGARLLHWIPQSEYIFDNQGRQRVRHILRFEHLTHDFDELMQLYNLTIDLELAATEKSGSLPATSRFGPQHMHEHVRQALETHFADDFALGGYSFFVPS